MGGGEYDSKLSEIIKTDRYEEFIKYKNKAFDLSFILERDSKAGKRTTLVEKSTGVIIRETKIQNDKQNTNTPTKEVLRNKTRPIPAK